MSAFRLQWSASSNKMTNRTYIPIALVFAAVLLSYLASPGGRQSLSAVNPSTRCQRIVSVAPSITEILYELGLGDEVVGVTRYCNYPPDALSKAKVGGYSDPNYEAIVMLEPDLVVILPEHEASRKDLERLDLNILQVNHRDIPGILNSIKTIGKECRKASKAHEIVSDIEMRMARLKERTTGLSRPRVLISVGRNMGLGSLASGYVAGRDTFYDEMLSLAGGVNAYRDPVVRFPVVSAEGILRLNPEVILDMVPDLKKRGWDEKMILREWSSVSGTDAVKNNRVHVFGHEYVVRPGPRFVLIIEEMARMIHPGVNRE